MKKSRRGWLRALSGVAAALVALPLGSGQRHQMAEAAAIEDEPSMWQFVDWFALAEEIREPAESIASALGRLRCAGPGDWFGDGYTDNAPLLRRTLGR